MTDMIERAAKAVYPLVNVDWDDARTISRVALLTALDPEDEALVRRLTTAIREEVVRQYRDDDRGNWPGGSHDYEEIQSPWLIARVAAQTLQAMTQGEL